MGKKHLPLVVIILLFLALTRYYGAAIPAYEGPDEYRHFAYVTKLVQTGELPHPPDDIRTVIQQQSGSPPLYYVSVALFLKLRDLDEWKVEPLKNPWWETSRSDRLDDNLNHFLMSPSINSLTKEQLLMEEALQWARLVSPLYGVIAILGVYWGGLALWPHDRKWVILATLLFALTPQLIQAFSMVSNDVGVIAFSTFIVGGGLHLSQRWQNRRILMITSLAMGLAVLCKANALALWPIPLMGVLLGWWQQHRSLTFQSFRPLFTSLSILGGIAAVVCGWWVVRSWLLYNDPLGIAPHREMTWMFDEPRSISLGFALRRIAHSTVDMWANFGWGGVRPEFWGYLLPFLVLIFGFYGLRKSYADRRILLLGLAYLLGLVAYLQWIRISISAPGRLMFPYYSALLLLCLSGLHRWNQKIHFWLAGMLGGLVIILVPTTIYPAFGPPPLWETPPDNLDGKMIDYGKVRFVGYQHDEIEAGENDIIVCWEAEDGDKKISVPYPFALRVVDEDGNIYGERASLPGMGNYTLWEPDKGFCDEVEIIVSEDFDETNGANISVELFDLETQKPISPETLRR